MNGEDFVPRKLIFQPKIDEFHQSEKTYRKI